MTACETNITCIAHVTFKIVNKALLVHNRWLRFSRLQRILQNFSVLKKCTNKFECLVYEMFFIHELRPTLNLQSSSQFVIRFLTSVLQVFSCIFLLSVYTCKNLYTSYVHIYTFTLLFYHSLDNDRSTVETSCFTVGFYLVFFNTMVQMTACETNITCIAHVTFKFVNKALLVHNRWPPKDLTKNFSVLKKCTNKFECLVYEMFFIHELRPTLNLQSSSQFVIRFLTSVLQVFSCIFLLSVYTCKHLYTSYVHIYTFTLLFYHSLDNDRSTVETSCFTVGFYR